MTFARPHILALLALALISGCMDPSQSGNLVARTVDEDPTLPQLSFNGSTFHLEAFGDETDPVIIILHGGPGADYRALLKLRQAVDGRRLEDDFHVIFWDQRGAGLSERHHADTLTIAQYDDDLDWLVDHFSPNRPVFLVGHSWGGMYAANYISNHPDKVAGAVLIEPGPLTGALFETVKDEIIKLDLFSEWLNDFLWAQTVVSADDHARSDFLMMVGTLSSDAQPGYGVSQEDVIEVWRFGAVAGQAVQQDGTRDGKAVWDFTTGLSASEAPVVLLASERNSVLGESLQKKHAAFFTNVEIVVMPDAGHVMPKTHPQETLAVIFGHLDVVNY